KDDNQQPLLICDRWEHSRKRVVQRKQRYALPRSAAKIKNSSKPTLQHTILIRAKGRFFRQTLGSGEINEDHPTEERAKILTKNIIYAIIYY
ncbi:hypothetical protein MOD58_19065, partial [Bacillus spizizenii]|nr:hypothetical protein [Bacillus spizizenii]